MKTTFLAREALEEPQSANDRHGALFARVGQRIYRYFYNSVWDREEAEELAHRTIAELLASIRERRYDGSRSFNTWLWLKAHSVFVDWCRQRDRALGELPEHVASPSSFETSVDRKLDGASVLQAVQRELGDEVYEVFILHYEAGLTREEVAEAVGRDRKTVAKRLDRAHALISKLLDQRKARA